MAQAKDSSEDVVYTERQKEIAAKARDVFFNGLHCAEAIVHVFNEAYGLEYDETVIRISTGFCAGLGKAKSLCGAVSGGVIVLSSVYGRLGMHGDADMSFDLVREYHDRVKEQVGDVLCSELTANVLWGHPDHIKHCKEIVYQASLILADILDRCIADFGPLIPEKKAPAKRKTKKTAKVEKSVKQGAATEKS